MLSRSWNRGLLPFAVLLQTTGCAPVRDSDKSPPPAPSALSTGTTTSDVRTGVADATPSVGQIVWPVAALNGQGTTCSGVLVSPTWLVTARHCIVGQVGKPPSNVAGSTAYISFQGKSDIAGPLFTLNPATAPGWGGTADLTNLHAIHTTKRGPVVPLHYFNAPHDPDGDDDLAHDLAFIQLDVRMPYSLVRPLHPPLSSVCPGEMYGRMIGYGPPFGDVGVGAPPQLNLFRNSAAEDGWEFNGTSVANGGGGYYFINFYYTQQYQASMPGDSGGALVDGNNPSSLCGIVSGWKDVVGGTTSECAAMDVPETINFITALPPGTPIPPNPPVPIVDAYGKFMGECPSWGPNGPTTCAPVGGVTICFDDIDTDGDLIPDGCDPAPLIADPTYPQTGVLDAKFAVTDPESGLWVGTPNLCAHQKREITVINGETTYAQADGDSDGIPDNCDNCPSVQNPDQSDADSDGLGNACDSCPTSANTNSCTPGTQCDAPDGHRDCVRVGNSPTNGVCEFQPDDSDHDGIGDACDDCKDWKNAITCSTNTPCLVAGKLHGGLLTNHSVPKFNVQPICIFSAAAAIAAKGGGVCWNQFDLDNDGRGDACDNCPLPPDSNWSYGPGAPGFGTGNLDSDGDGLGDQCDLCKNADATVPCTLNSDCTGPGLKNTCLGEGVALRVCAGAPNQDGDVLPDACDNCTNVPNDDQFNCNAVEEHDQQAAGNSVPILGDACDPIPCATTQASQGTKNANGQAVVPIAYAPNVLPNSPKHDRAGFPALSHRHPTKVVAQTKFCPKSATTCPRGTSTFGGLSWGAIDQANDPAPGFSIDSANRLIFPTAVDAAAGHVQGALGAEPAYISSADALQNYTTVWNVEQQFGQSIVGGSLFTHVSQVSVSILLGNISVGLPDFTSLSNSYVLNKAFGTYPPAPPYGNGGDCKQTKAPHCVFNTGGWDNPPGSCGSGAISACAEAPPPPAWQGNPGVLLVPSADATLPPRVRTSVGDTVVADAFAGTSLSALAAADVVVTPSETIPELEGTTARYAGISSRDRSLVTMLAADSTGRYADITGGRTVPPREAAQLVAASTAPLSNGFAAALSARRSSVFVVGGRDESGALTGGAMLLLPDGTASTIVLTGSTRPANVLAVVYSPGEESLYVVDRDAPESPGKIRLLRIDMPSGAVNVLGRWHASKLVDRYFLSRDLDGSVVLLASSSFLERFWGGTVRADDGHVTLHARFAGKGLAMLPAMKTVTGTKVALYHSSTERVEPTVLSAKIAHGQGKGDGEDDEIDCDDVLP